MPRVLDLPHCRDVLVRSPIHDETMRTYVRTLVSDELFHLLTVAVDIPPQFRSHPEVVDEEGILIKMLKKTEVSFSQREFTLLFEILI